jgi:exodeoxyribonuclease VII large subunit
VDVILVARGGGSLEDLWAFNDERVVRAVANSQIPIISGVGHETDFTLTDFAADLRAPTPTAAAELAVPDQMEVRDRLVVTTRRLANALSSITQDEKMRLGELTHALTQVSPLMQVRSDRQRLDEWSGRAQTSLQHYLQISHSRSMNLSQKLNTLNPYSVRKRGYAIVTNSSGEIIHRVEQTFENDLLSIRVADGHIQTRVTAEPVKYSPGGNNHE